MLNVKHSVLTIAIGFVLVLSTSSLRLLAVSESTLQGVWQAVDQTAGRPVAGLLIIHGAHYSLLTVNPERPDVDDVANASADELRAMWQPMAANAGVFEVSGHLLTIRPVAAKNPRVMRPGAYEVYEFRLEGKTLWLTQRRSVRGPVENGATVKFNRVE